MKKKLTNPFVLALQGFVAGAILFWSTQAVRQDSVQPADTAPTAGARQFAGL